MPTSILSVLERNGYQVNPEILYLVHSNGLSFQEYVNKKTGVSFPPARNVIDTYFKVIADFSQQLQNLETKVTSVRFLIVNTWIFRCDAMLTPHPSGKNCMGVLEDKIRSYVRANRANCEILVEKLASQQKDLNSVEAFREDAGTFYVLAPNQGIMFPSLLLQGLYGHVGAKTFLLPARFIRESWNDYGKGERERWYSFLKQPFAEVVRVKDSDTPATAEIIETLLEGMSLNDAVKAARLI